MTPRALQAVILDFDGVIANSEPLHFRAFQDALAEEAIELTREDYYQRYHGFDDVGLIEAVAKDRGLAMSGAAVGSLVERKGRRMQALLEGGAVLFPGATEFIRQSAAAVPLAVASGAMRHEIEEILEGAHLMSCFRIVVAAGDTPESKPSPQPYRLAFSRLCENTGLALEPHRCVAVEDSRWGLASARGAGLRCVGVTNSYPASELPFAELIVDGLDALSLEMLDSLVGGAGPRS